MTEAEVSLPATLATTWAQQQFKTRTGGFPLCTQHDYILDLLKGIGLKWQRLLQISMQRNICAHIFYPEAHQHPQTYYKSPSDYNLEEESTDYKGGHNRHEILPLPEMQGWTSNPFPLHTFMSKYETVHWAFQNEMRLSECCSKSRVEIYMQA